MDYQKYGKVFQERDPLSPNQELRAGYEEIINPLDFKVRLPNGSDTYQSLQIRGDSLILHRYFLAPSGDLESISTTHINRESLKTTNAEFVGDAKSHVFYLRLKMEPGSLTVGNSAESGGWSGLLAEETLAFGTEEGIRRFAFNAQKMLDKHESDPKALYARNFTTLDIPHELSLTLEPILLERFPEFNNCYSFASRQICTAHGSVQRPWLAPDEIKATGMFCRGLMYPNSFRTALEKEGWERVQMPNTLADPNDTHVAAFIMPGQDFHFLRKVGDVWFHCFSGSGLFSGDVASDAITNPEAARFAEYYYYLGTYRLPPEPLRVQLSENLSPDDLQSIVERVQRGKKGGCKSYRAALRGDYF